MSRRTIRPRPPPHALRAVRRLPLLPARRRDAHKGDFGRVLVVGGARGMIGAPALCANAALRGGAGLVRIAVESPLLEAVGTLAPCATAVGLPPLDRFAPPAVWRVLGAAADAADVLAVGPGWSNDAARAAMLRRILSDAARPVVLDADGLNNLARLPDWPAVVRRRTASSPLVLTPHPAEAQRLLDAARIEVDARRQRGAAAAALAEASGAVLVLKGAGTIVTDARRVYINRTGNPGMATGGSGDVLTGLIAALIGQRLSPFDAAVLGVFLHGRAGDLAARRLGEASMMATDLLDVLPDAFRERRRRATRR